MISFRRFFVSSLTVAVIVLPPSNFAQQVQTTPMRSSSEANVLVKAPAGTLEGRAEGSLRVFRGIPYALPPVGSLRWKPPRPMPRWNGIKKATEFGSACFQPQPTLSKIYVRGPKPMSEDCLTLNVWAPAGSHKAPVFVWIHGGSLLTGFGGDPMYNGSQMASRGIVVVTINYRVGVLGWLAHPELSKESPLQVSGNYGLLDQIEALRWVHHNIGAFGGDPSNVTIAGESSGGLSVTYLMAAPSARGLFAKSIVQSTYMATTPELKQGRFGLLPAEEVGAKLADALHMPNIAALRAMDGGTLTAVAVAEGFAPSGTIDGRVLPRQLVEVFDRGEQAPVPLLTGFNSGEIRSLRILAPPPPASAAEYEAIIRDRYADLADEFLRLYPSANLQESVLATTRDAFYGWSSMRLVEKQTALGVPSFLYFWDHGYPAADAAGLHGFHASEVPYVFGTFSGTPPLWPKNPDTEEEKTLSEAMTDYWTSFARTGHPTAKHGPAWPAFGSAGAYMNITDAPHPSSCLLPGMYELTEEVVCRRRARGDQPWHWNVGIVSPKLPAQQAQCKQTQKCAASPER
ncbi:MAG TPA: carboxylesterase family protein [Terriglobales bacterium]|nr:carboxylesterase family protein [Terriglobales bacterium]